MTSDGTSILWDAADYYQVVQNYLSQELHAGRSPSGRLTRGPAIRFLADPQVGPWYPLNWPFFLIGVSPHVLFCRALAAFSSGLPGGVLSGPGDWCVTAKLRCSPGCGYGLSGFSSGHSSSYHHAPMRGLDAVACCCCWIWLWSHTRCATRFSVDWRRECSFWPATSNHPVQLFSHSACSLSHEWFHTAPLVPDPGDSLGNSVNRHVDFRYRHWARLGIDCETRSAPV